MQKPEHITFRILIVPQVIYKFKICSYLIHIIQKLFLKRKVNKSEACEKLYIINRRKVD